MTGAAAGQPPQASKVMILGMDAVIAPRMYDYAQAGHLPHIRALIDRGVWGTNCLSPFPTITPPNWTTIVTGATLGTHGITDFNVHVPGDPLNETHQGFDTSECQAEYLWQASARAGKRSIVVNYPSSWPPTVGDAGVQVGGAGLWVNEWRYQTPAAVGAVQATLADDQLFATEEYPQGTTIALRPAQGWSGIDGLDGALEAELPLAYRRARFSVAPQTWHLLAQAIGGRGYDRVLVTTSKHVDDQTVLARLQVGEWSPIRRRTFDTAQGPREAGFACKLLELSPDASQLRLYLTGLAALDGWAHPAGLAADLRACAGLPLPNPGFAALNLEWIDQATFLEVLEMAHHWLGDVATHLLTNQPWDLYVMHVHTPDHAYHGFATKMDPATARSPEQAASFQATELGFYRSLDDLIGRIVACADQKETVMVLTSDHGAKATTNRFQAARVLISAGLTVLEDGAAPGEVWAGRAMGAVVDWSRTRAVAQRTCYVYVNVKGRDPEGIVEPGEEYDQVREQIIQTLYNCTDPATGKKPVLLALRREDARVLGLWGDRVGDVVYAISPEYGGQHGPHLPTATWGLGNLRALFLMAGPGLRQGLVLERTIWLQDIVPTLCYLTGWPVPRQAEGAVVYQALADADGPPRQFATLRRNYERLKQAYESDQAMTHTYNE